MEQTLLSALTSNGITYEIDAPMCEHTAFKTGGPADLITWPSSIDQVAFLIETFRGAGTPFTVLGGASNVIVMDEGIEGAVIMIGKNLADIQVEGRQVIAQAGAKLSTLVRRTHEAGLVGLEFAGGIPGTVGGGVYMNAGAFDGTLSDFVSCACTIDYDGQLHTYFGEDLAFGYRDSVFMHVDEIILSCIFQLEHGNVDEAKQKLRSINAKRREKQPVELPSAGSTFKRPPGNFAGTLIESCNLKGYCVGGAKVSEKHAGFIVNAGGATSKDILAVISHVEETVKHKTGVSLEREVRIIGRGA